MPSYDFRLRINFSEGYRIESDVEEIELLVTSLGERIKLRSGSLGKPIKDHDSVAIIGGPYASEYQARTAAEKSKFAILYWAIESHSGIDFGDRELKPQGFVTKFGLAALEKQFGYPLRNDLPGIDVYEHVENLKFVQFGAKATVGRNPPKLIDTFQSEYLNNREFTKKQMLAGEIYASSFFDVSPLSRFITLVTAVEALLDPQKRSDEALALVEEFKAKTQQSTVDKLTRESIIGSLNRIKCESIRQAGRTMAECFIPSELFSGQSSSDFFARSYDLRSDLIHNGTVKDEKVKIRDLANVMETFVGHLLIAVLNDDIPRGHRNKIKEEEGGGSWVE
ncbi:hypothetical protein ES703_67206 [subsurface metagenome]